MHLADRNAAKFTDDVVTALLASYSPAAAGAIRSEAHTWRYGDVESARASYDKTLEFARLQPHAPARRYHAWGAWYANDGLTYVAMHQVMAELGECSEGEAHL